MNDAELDAYDAAWKGENLAILRRAERMPVTTMSEYLMAAAMFARFAECERVRLDCRHAVLVRREGQRR